MIHSQDRSYYIGASDTSYVVGNWNTKTFDNWYGTKLGIYSNSFSNIYTKAGTAYEHKILESLFIPGLQMDKQMIKGRLRVNLDGNTESTIYEVKTYKYESGFTLSRAYKNQVNVEMYAYEMKQAFIVSYGLTDAEYKNFYIDIDPDRITYHPIPYNHDFINDIYLPRFEYLSDCLDKGVWPKCMN